MPTKNIFIQRCFDLARLGINSTSPNPSVGAVIVNSNNEIIGEGWTSAYGGAHAEVNAFKSVKPENQHQLTTSTLFVSLEPCYHFGKTPPCVDLILREKIPNVVIAYSDPFPQVAGKSIEKLKQNGVSVTLLQANNINNKNATLLPFFSTISSKRPFVILKWAETANGFIGNSNQTMPLSNAYTKRLVHKWRSESDAIMVGTHTAALDNPELTNRHYFGKSPIRVVLDGKQRLDDQLHIFDGSIKTLIYTEGGDLSLKKHRPSTLEFRTVPFDDNLLPHILDDLYRQNIGILFVEGGAQLLRTFIEKGLWDEARVFKTPKTMMDDGVPAPQLTSANLENQMQLDNNQLLIFRHN